MICAKGLRQPDVTDLARETASGELAMITGFFREAPPEEAGACGRLLVACAPFHEKLCLLRVAGSGDDFLRPWAVDWEGPGRLTETDIARMRKRYYGEECNRHGSSMIDIGPGCTLHRYGVLTSHEQLTLMQWRRDTHALIEAWEEKHAPRTLRRAS